MFKNNQHIKDFLNKRLNWGVLFFEVRDDLISKKTFNLIKSIVPLNKLLLSLRDKKTYFTTSDLNKAWAWDWPIEKKLENCNFKIPFSIISLHSKKDNLSKSNLSKSNVSKQNLSKPSFSYLESQINLANKYNLKYKNSKKVHCKWSPTIESIESLQNLYTWFKKDSDNRSILPMSLSGRWDWFRLFLYGKIKINFIKENRNSFFKDQILLADKILTEIFTDKILTEKCLANKQTNFAAILGSPVSHSLTPFVHYDFFCDKKIPVYSILLNKNDITKNNVDFLIKLGLKYAAITSPLKKEFFNLKHLQIKLSHKAKNCKSINSLSVAQNKTKQNKTAQNKTKPNQITQNKTKQNQTKQNKTTQNKTKQNKIILDNTDQEGLAELIKSIFDNKNITTKDQKKIALWGSGGVSFMLSDAYPEICIFSSQQKKCISHNIIEKNYLPDIILWAVPGMYNSTPPKHWSPRHVVDLNYSQDSGGREYAILKNLDYTNGLLMFLSQAKEQQKLWNKN
ncbi:MAG: hypothetical protein HAW60_06245 [Bdellovibrionales bacterium]|nr:hypothetical protein [Bdellovibrionales bacterium]